MKQSTGLGWVLAFWFLWCLLSLAATAAVVYIVLHFVLKYW